MNRTPDITRLQQRFQARVLSSTPSGPDGPDRIERSIVATAHAGVEERLGVYTNAYRLRLLEVLGKDYPALRALIGDTQFQRLGRAYLDAHPSDTPSVRWFGRHLAAYLRAHAPFRRRPVLAEMAEFEWLQGEAFDAPDAALLSSEQVTRIATDRWAHMRLVAHPSLRRLDLLWNVPVLWKAFDEKRKAPKPPVKPRAGATRVAWALWRSGLVVRWRSLAPDEGAALDAMTAGKTFAEVCDRIGEWIAPDRAALHSAGLLKRWLVDGWVSAVSLPALTEPLNKSWLK
ncbi:MAG: DNA-binding domain-containing protein [Burkholderiales bacterium]